MSSPNTLASGESTLTSGDSKVAYHASLKSWLSENPELDTQTATFLNEINIFIKDKIVITHPDDTTFPTRPDDIEIALLGFDVTFSNHRSMIRASAYAELAYGRDQKNLDTVITALRKIYTVHGLPRELQIYANRFNQEILPLIEELVTRFIQ